MAAQGKQVRLYLMQEGPLGMNFRWTRVPNPSHVGIELVGGSIGMEPHVGLGNALSAVQGSGSFVAGFGVDLHGRFPDG
jgi:hypothetical protein